VVMEARQSEGGTAPEQVLKQIAEAKRFLET
jgi:argininosuccinate lyase